MPDHFCSVLGLRERHRVGVGGQAVLPSVRPRGERGARILRPVRQVWRARAGGVNEVLGTNGGFRVVFCFVW